MEQFSSLLSSTIDSTLGLRCKLYGYQYSEIIRSLLCVYFCGGSCVEDVTTHLAGHLSLHPTLRKVCTSILTLLYEDCKSCHPFVAKKIPKKAINISSLNKQERETIIQQRQQNLFVVAVVLTCQTKNQTKEKTGKWW